MKRSKLLIIESIFLLTLLALGIKPIVADLVVNSVSDLNKKGVIIAVQTGTTSDLYAQANLPEATVKGFSGFDQAVEAVINKDAHVLLGDLPVLNYYALENSSFGLKMVGTFGDAELFGIGVRKSSTYFLDALNAALKKIIDDGTYDTIYSKWFVGTPSLTDDSNASTATTFPAAPGTSTTLDSVIAAGKIVFGSDTTYPPLEFLNGSKVIGFDADIGSAIAAKFSAQYGKTIVSEMMTTDWDTIIPTLQQSGFDAILSSMTKTPERALQISFTRSYYTSKQGILQGPKSFSAFLPIPVLPIAVTLVALPLLRKLKKN